MKEPIHPPGLMLRLLEGRALAEASAVMMQLPLLRFQARRGKGEPVLVLPGFMADDTSTLLLRHYLATIGYDARGWGLGVNRHRMLDFLPAVTELVASMVTERFPRVILVGWSRGGIISREVARDRPDLVDRVITIGSPVKGGASVSSIGGLVRRETGMTPDQINHVLRDRQRTPINVPIRAIYSRTDGVVAWKACIDDVSPDIQHYEVPGSHTGMGTNVDVFRMLPRLLAESVRQAPNDQDRPVP